MSLYINYLHGLHNDDFQLPLNVNLSLYLIIFYYAYFVKFIYCYIVILQPGNLSPPILPSNFMHVMILCLGISVHFVNILMYMTKLKVGSVLDRSQGATMST